MKKQKFQPSFLVDKQGKPVAVQLNIKAYEALLEEIEDVHDVKRAEMIIAKKSKMHTLQNLEKTLLKKRIDVCNQ